MKALIIQHFSLLVAMATNQNEEFAQNLHAWKRTIRQTFLKMFRQNTCNRTVINVNCHFIHKSMETKFL